MSKKLRYSEFEHKVDLDRLYEAIEFEPTSQRREWDQGFCVFPSNHATGDTTGKFGINRERRIYNCWVCGGGDLLSLAMEWLDVGVDEATHWLYQFTRQESEERFLDEFERDLQDVERRVATLPYFNARVLERWQGRPHDIERFMWHKWAIDPEIADEAQVGFDEMHTRRVKGETYIGAALIFPVFWKDRLVGWQERWLEPDEDRPEWVPKYTNTTDLPRQDIVYGYDEALRGPLRRAKVFAVESVPSKLALQSAGLNAVSTLGSNASDAQKRLLRRFTQGVVLCPDNDPALKKGKKPTGLKWRDDLAGYLERFVPLTLLPAPPVADKEDVADLLAKHPERFFDYLRSGKDPLDDLLSDT